MPVVKFGVVLTHIVQVCKTVFMNLGTYLHSLVLILGHHWKQCESPLSTWAKSVNWFSHKTFFSPSVHIISLSIHKDSTWELQISWHEQLDSQWWVVVIQCLLINIIMEGVFVGTILLIFSLLIIVVLAIYSVLTHSLTHACIYTQLIPHSKVLWCRPIYWSSCDAYSKFVSLTFAH